jgi:hypothetical protein
MIGYPLFMFALIKLSFPFFVHSHLCLLVSSLFNYLYVLDTNLFIGCSIYFYVHLYIHYSLFVDYSSRVRLSISRLLFQVH